MLDVKTKIPEPFFQYIVRQECAKVPNVGKIIYSRTTRIKKIPLVALRGAKSSSTVTWCCKVSSTRADRLGSSKTTLQKSPLEKTKHLAQSPTDKFGVAVDDERTIGPRKRQFRRLFPARRRARNTEVCLNSSPCCSTRASAASGI